MSSGRSHVLMRAISQFSAIKKPAPPSKLSGNGKGARLSFILSAGATQRQETQRNLLARKAEVLAKPIVLQLIGNLHAAGSERQAAQLAQSLHESKHFNVSVACMDPRGTLGEELHQAGFAEIPSFRLNSFYDHTMIFSLSRFARFLNQRKVDIIHTHDFYT